MTFQFFISANGSSESIFIKIVGMSDDDTLRFKTPLQIERGEWDFNKQRPKNIYLKKYKKIFEKMNFLKLELKSYLQKKKDSHSVPNQRTVSKKIKQICEQVSYDLTKDSLLAMMAIYIASKENMICNSTLKRYRVFFRMIRRYEGYSLNRLYINTIDSNLVNDFISFGIKESYTESTIYRTLHFIRTILNFAEKKGIKTSVRELYFRREKQNREVITLSEKEILQIKNTTVPPDLQTAKDWLIISCYTGQRFSDFMNFSTQQIIEVDGKVCITFEQQKTKKKVLLALHPTVRKIIRNNNNCFPGLLNMQHYNEDIKKVAELSNIRDVLSAKKRLGFRCSTVKTEKFNFISAEEVLQPTFTEKYPRLFSWMLPDIVLNKCS